MLENQPNVGRDFSICTAKLSVEYLEQVQMDSCSDKFTRLRSISRWINEMPPLKGLEASGYHVGA